MPKGVAITKRRSPEEQKGLYLRMNDFLENHSLKEMVAKFGVSAPTYYNWKNVFEKETQKEIKKNLQVITPKTVQADPSPAAQAAQEAQAIPTPLTIIPIQSMVDQKTQISQIEHKVDTMIGLLQKAKTNLKELNKLFNSF